MIHIEAIDEETFRVRIDGQTSTTHTVTLRREYYESLTGGRVEPETLIRESFEFILQKEPKTSILRSFDLPIIGHYFPDYEATIRKAF